MYYVLIKYDFALNTIWISQYFGNYSGNEVVYMGAPLRYTQLERQESIAGYTLNFLSGQKVYVYNSSTFYTIKEAYEKNIISKEDVYNIGLLLD